MAKYIREITNPEVFSVHPSQAVADARDEIVAMRISAAPVLSKSGGALGLVTLRDLIGAPEVGRVQDYMSSPVHVIPMDATIEEAGRKLAELNVHHLLSVDEHQVVQGVVSSLDVMRGLLGIPVRHPETFAHKDADGIKWTDLAVMDEEHAIAAPNGPGVLVLVRGKAGEAELPLWAESPHNVATRLLELLSIPQDDESYLAGLLERHRAHLRFRAALIPDPEVRASALRKAHASVTKVSKLPLPSWGTA